MLKQLLGLVQFKTLHSIQGMQSVQFSVVTFFHFSEIRFVCTDIAICDLVHDMETVYHIC